MLIRMERTDNSVTAIIGAQGQMGKRPQSLSITFIFFPLIDLYNQQFKLKMSLAKKKRSVHVKCFRAQELNTHLNN